MCRPGTADRTHDANMSIGARCRPLVRAGVPPGSGEPPGVTFPAEPPVASDWNQPARHRLPGERLRQPCRLRGFRRRGRSARVDGPMPAHPVAARKRDAPGHGCGGCPPTVFRSPRRRRWRNLVGAVDFTRRRPYPRLCLSHGTAHRANPTLPEPVPSPQRAPGGAAEHGCRSSMVISTT